MSARRRSWMLLAGGSALGVAALVWQMEREHVAQDVPGVVQLSVPAGAMPRTLPLADGSRVMLAPGSSVTSHGVFGAGSRELTLQGEAIFTVSPGSIPFVVHTEGARIEDVSTAFLVRAIPGSPASGLVPRTMVTVTEGAVLVRAGRFTATLTEGHGLLLDRDGGHTELGTTAAMGSVAWLGGALLFNDEPMPSAVERLQRWTGFRIVLDSSLMSSRLSTAIEGETPSGMLQQVARVLHARAVDRGDHWELRPAS